MHFSVCSFQLLKIFSPLITMIYTDLLTLNKQYALLFYRLSVCQTNTTDFGQWCFIFLKHLMLTKNSKFIQYYSQICTLKNYNFYGINRFN
jgi:hypothetical protein